jgi:molecular chaperone GrpE
VSKRKHGSKGAPDAEQPEPIPDAQAVEGALWSEAEAAAPEPRPPGGMAPPADPGSAAGEPSTANLPEQSAAEIARLQGQAAEYLDGWQRARAEFANYKKRIEREQEEARGRVVADLLQDFTAILDDLERALKDRPGDGDAGAWASGIDMIQRKLMAVLEAEGVKAILPSPGEAFDPNVHEAVSHEASESRSEGQIIDIIHQGYRIGERVIRPALVRVAK